MTTKKKVLIGIGGLLVVALIIAGTVYQSHKGVVEVQTGKVAKTDLASTVTASGEIRPKTFANVGANAFGKIVKLYVKEGDKVKKGQLLAQLENVQPESDVQAGQATVSGFQNRS